MLRTRGAACACCAILWAAGCSDASQEATTARASVYDAAQDGSGGRCPSASRSGAVDENSTAAGVRFSVRAPSNYDPTRAHPLLVVFAPAGVSRFASERFTGLTPIATAAGFVVAYADSPRMSLRAVIDLGSIPARVSRGWCIDPRRVFFTGHSDGGTVSTALAVLESTRSVPAAIAPSAAGMRGSDLQAYPCPAPLSVMVMHNLDDRHFPHWGEETVRWWAQCNRCDPTPTPRDAAGCSSYPACAAGVTTLFCGTPGGHARWPGLNRRMIEFFLAAPPKETVATPP